MWRKYMATEITVMLENPELKRSVDKFWPGPKSPMLNLLEILKKLCATLFHVF
jgi:hypothetical protein